MIETSVKINYELQKEINYKAFVTSIILLSISLVAMLLFVFLSDLLGGKIEWVIIVISASILFVVSLINVIMINQVNHKACEEDRELRYVFNEYYYTVEETKNTEIVTTAKIYYKDVFKIRETKNYFLVYRTAQVVHPINKNAISLEQLAEIKNSIAKTKK